MKHKFKVGQRIRCIDAADKLKNRQVYTVESTDGYFVNVGKAGKYFAWRFVPEYSGTGGAILRTSTNGFRFNLVAANNEKIATSEVYTTKAMAVKTIKKYFPDFEIVDKTKG